MFVNSFFVQSGHDLALKRVNKEVKFWARNGRRSTSEIIFWDMKINGKIYFFSYCERYKVFRYGPNAERIDWRVPRVYYTVDGMQFCVTAKGRLWVKQL